MKYPKITGLGMAYAAHKHQNVLFDMQMSVCSILYRLQYNPFTFDTREIGRPNSFIPGLLLLADKKLYSPNDDKSESKDEFSFHEEPSKRIRLAVVECCHTDKDHKTFEADKVKVREMMHDNSTIRYGFVINYTDKNILYRTQTSDFKPISFNEAIDKLINLAMTYYLRLADEFLENNKNLELINCFTKTPRLLCYFKEKTHKDNLSGIPTHDLKPLPLTPANKKCNRTDNTNRSLRTKPVALSIPQVIFNSIALQFFIYLISPHVKEFFEKKSTKIKAKR